MATLTAPALPTDIAVTGLNGTANPSALDQANNILSNHIIECKEQKTKGEGQECETQTPQSALFANGTVQTDPSQASGLILSPSQSTEDDLHHQNEVSSACFEKLMSLTSDPHLGLSDVICVLIFNNEFGHDRMVHHLLLTNLLFIIYWGISIRFISLNLWVEKFLVLTS